MSTHNTVLLYSFFNPICMVYITVLYLEITTMTATFIETMDLQDKYSISLPASGRCFPVLPDVPETHA